MDQPPSSQPDRERPSARRALAGVRVVVVEDDDDARELLQELLVREGALVRDSSSADEALGVVGEFYPDVVLSDIGMPVRDGYWLAREIHKRWPALPLVAVTAFASSQDAERAKAAGFLDHLPKPVDRAKLVSALVSASRQRELAGPPSSHS